MIRDDSLLFDPPDHGLLSGEIVIWKYCAGISFMTIFCGVCLPLLTVIPGIFIFFFFGTFVGYTFLFFILLGLLFTGRRFIDERGTVYYFTSQRVIVVISDYIHKAILLDHLEGKQPSEFLEIKQTHVENNSPIYKVAITDEESSIALIIKNLNEDTMEEFQKLGVSKKCPNCGFENIGVRTHCRNCEAVLK
jgi:hypothetical protein